MALIAAGVMAAAGLVKTYAVDKPKENRERHLAAETQRYSPWTGLKADKVQEADPAGNAMQYGLTGAQMYQNVQGQQLQNDNLKAQTKWLENGYTPYGNTWGGQRATLSGPVDPIYQQRKNLYGGN